MRVTYLPPSALHYDNAFANQNVIRGKGIQDIQVYHQRGGNLFGVLGGLVRRALPFLKRIVLPEVGNFVQNVSNDYAQNIPFKQTL